MIFLERQRDPCRAEFGLSLAIVAPCRYACGKGGIGARASCAQGGIMGRIFIFSALVVAAVLAALYFYGLGGPAPVTQPAGDQAEPAVIAPSVLEPAPMDTTEPVAPPQETPPAPQ
jgi:hypothetical protein